MTDKLVGYVVVAVVLSLVGTFVGSAVVDKIQAPIKKERDDALNAAKTNKETADRLTKQAAELSLANQRLRAKKDEIDRQRANLATEIEQLRQRDKEVRAWTDSPMPSALLEWMRLDEGRNKNGNAIPDPRP